MLPLLSQSVSWKIHQLWRSYVFWKCSKLNANLQDWKKKWENVSRLFYYCSSKFCYNIRLLRREYLLPAVSGLTNSPKIFHITERVFKPELPSKGSINMVKVPPFRYEQCFSPFTMLLFFLIGNHPMQGWPATTRHGVNIKKSTKKITVYRESVYKEPTVKRCLFKGPPKRDFPDIYLTTSFGVCKFKKTSAMRVIFFLKLFKIECKFTKWKQKNEKIIFLSYIIASENLAIVCVY